MLAAGCAGEELKLALGEQCDLNSECDTPLVCRLTRCRIECATVRDCPVGSRCVRDELGLGGCTLPDENLCGTNSDCPEPLVCEENGCTNGCVNDRDCAPGATCEDGVCVEVVEELCAVDLDCTAPDVCARDGVCRPQCRADRDCREGSACAGGVCMPIAEADAGPTPADAGTDGGPVDAGTDGGADAGGGTVDAGSDAGTECASAAECGRRDHTATTDCVAGRCEVATCEDDFGDCNGLYEDGCEVSLETDVNHCGDCATACAAGQACLAGCVTASLTELSLGREHSCALWSTGQVTCWGSTMNGQVGDGRTSLTFSRPVPALVKSLADAVDISAGNDHTCAVRSGGQVVCWGSDSVGQLGDGTAGGTGTTPSPVAGITGATQVIAGLDFACALHGSTVSRWGQQEFGRLGNGSTTAAIVATPVAASVPDPASLVETHGASACAWRSSGGLMCWGSNGGGGLGDGTTTNRGTPVDATALSGLTLAVVAVGETSYGIDDTGGAHCWGGPYNFRCGPPAPSFTPITSPYAYTSITTAVAADAGNASYLLLSDGRLLCWSLNDRGQCGNGTTESPLDRPTETGITDATMIAAGQDHACIVRSSGGVWCTGTNLRGQLGIGSAGGGDVPSFTRVVGLP